MTKFVFKEELTDKVLEEFSVSSAFFHVLEVLTQDYPMIDIFSFPQAKQELEELQNKYSETPVIRQSCADKADMSATIDKLKAFFESGEAKALFERMASDMQKMERLKKIPCGKLAKGLKSFLDVMAEERKYTRRYRFSYKEGEYTCTCSSWNGLVINEKRVCLDSGIGKCTMGIYDESQKGFSEVCDITTVKSLESNEGTIRIQSHKFQLKELQPLSSLLAQLEEYKQDAVILFYMMYD